MERVEDIELCRITDVKVKELIEAIDTESIYADVEVEEEVSITDIDWLNKDVLIKLEK